MKKFLCVFVCIAMILTFASCSSKESVLENARKDKETTKETLENVFFVRENTFVATVDSIYIDTNYYINNYNYVKYVGFVLNQSDPTDNSISYPWVCRYGPGCCGSGRTPGFVVVYDGELPSDETWVEVTGKLKIAEQGDPIYDYLYDLLGPLYTQDDEEISTYAYFSIERILPAKSGLETVGFAQ